MLSTVSGIEFKPAFGLRYAGKIPQVDKSTNSIMIDRSKCQMCMGCVKACKNIAGIGAIKAGQGKIVPSKGTLLSETKCIKCGQCTLQCPFGAITERDEVDEVMKAIKAHKHKVVQTAPAVRVAISESLGLPAGTISTGKLVTALKRLGFEKVYDTNWSADLTIIEEATELITRIKRHDKLPMFTSCCPAWINYIEQSRPDLIPQISTCKSPLSMLSAVIREENKDKDLLNVAIMPCTAKKDEIKRPQLKGDTDYVLTTRELAKMIKKAKIDFKSLPDTPFDKVYGESSGAGAIFAATGGVMEAAIRTAYYKLTGKTMENLDFLPVRGIKDGVKIAPLDINGLKIKVGVAHGIKNAQKLLKMIDEKSPEVEGLAFVEVMACPGGCVCGGGNIKPKNKKIMQKRLDAIYKIDKTSKIRQSHENTEIKEVYERLLGEPNSHKAHMLLHTHYTDRK